MTVKCAKAVLAAVGMASMMAGAIAVTAVTATAAVEAQGNKKAGKAKKDKKGNGNDTTVVVVIDVDGHRGVVREYVTGRNLPPGLAKRRALPPGLSQQLRERGALPPGLRDYYTPVPADWRGRFPAIPVYYTRYFVGSHLIIIDTRNDTLVSLIRDILD